MKLDLIRADIYLTEHRLRVAHADRFGSLLPTSNASAAPRRRPIVAVTAVLARVGERLRLTPHPAAAGGIGPSGD